MTSGVHQTEDKLLDFAYGELPAHEASAVDAHVRSCAKCSQSLDQIRSVRSMFAPLPMVGAPDAGLESLLAYAEQHARRKAPAPVWRRWVLGFASAAALMVVGVVAVRASKESPQSAADVIVQAEHAKKEAAAVSKEGGAKEDVFARAEQKDAPVAAAAPVPAPSVPAEKEKAPEPEPSADRLAALFDSREGKRAAPKQPSKPADEPKLADPQKQLGGYENYGNAGRAVGLLDRKMAEEEVLAEEKAKKKRDVEVSAGKDLAKGGFDKAGAAKNNVDDQMNDGTTVSQGMGGSADRGGRYGLGTGSSYQSGRAAEADEAQAVWGGDQKPVANKKSAKTEAPPPPVAAPKVDSMPQPVVAETATKAPQKSSYGLPVPRTLPSSMPSAGPQNESLDVASEREDADTRRREQARTVQSELAAARSSSSTGDVRGEVAAAVRALNAGATGYERAEALKRACDGYDALGEADRAAQFCDRLLAEFGSTAAAKQVAQRRARSETPAAAPATKKAKKYEPAAVDAY